MTKKSDLIHSLANILKPFNYIDFAVLFGSLNSGHYTILSDIDIGIYTTRAISFLELGFLNSKLEMAINRKPDVVLLNDLYKKNAIFANQIVINSSIIVLYRETRFIEFKKNTYLYFLDMKYLNEMMNRSFIKRVDQGRFGERIYA